MACDGVLASGMPVEVTPFPRGPQRLPRQSFSLSLSACVPCGCQSPGLPWGPQLEDDGASDILNDYTEQSTPPPQPLDFMREE